MKLLGEKGFTLVEVLVAVLLIAVATTALVTCVTSATKINATAMEKDEAFQDNLLAVNNGAVDPTEGTIAFGSGEYDSVAVYYYSSNHPKGENLTSIIKK